MVALGRKQADRRLEEPTPRTIGIPISRSDGHIAQGTASAESFEAEDLESQQHGLAGLGPFSPDFAGGRGVTPVCCKYIPQQPVSRRVGLGIVLPAIILLAGLARAEPAPPVIPVGPDAYLRWDLWPYQRIGARAYLRSTYDRLGGNEGADASHFLYQVRDDFNVTTDVAGKGVLYFVRYNHWHGSPWHYEIDGRDRLVAESNTADPDHEKPGAVFLPENAFPHPVAVTWSETNGADLSWVPIGFTRSFRMAYSRTHYGTGYYIFDQYVGGARLSRPISGWDAEAPPEELARLFASAGSDIAPKAGSPGVTELSGEFDLPAGQAVRAWEWHGSPQMLRAIDISIPRDSAPAFSRAGLRIRWDGRTAPSVDAPVALFFGAGTLYNRDGREYLVKGFPMVVRFSRDRVYLHCYFPMPFFHSVELAFDGDRREAVHDVRWNVRFVPLKDSPEQVGYFHATYRDHPTPQPGHDLVLLDTNSIEGATEWSGQLVGTSLIFSQNANLQTLEGDPRFFFDDSQTPQAQGTGTEEWCGGGDYWGGKNMTLPFAGHPAGVDKAELALDPQDKIETAYRFLLGDLMPFGRNARIQLEHGGNDESTEHYETVAYWYGLPAASMVLSDTFLVGDADSEKRHRYVSPNASEVREITSRYEWGPDTLNGKECYPPSTDRGRFTDGTSEFVLRVDPKNYGVLLRRKLDYAFPNQRARVWVADDLPGSPTWAEAGIWYTAGANTCVYSNPRSELGATVHTVETSNRRFRDDEFLLPLSLTRGRSLIRVRVKFEPMDVPLFPGHPLAPQGWSEMRYTCYSLVVPKFAP